MVLEVHAVVPPGQGFTTGPDEIAGLELPEDLVAWVEEHPNLTVTETTEAENGDTILVLGALPSPDDVVWLLCETQACLAQRGGQIVKLQLGPSGGEAVAVIWINSEVDTFEAWEAKAGAVVSTIEAAEPAGEAATLQIAADPDGALAYDQTALAAPTGTITVEFTNEAALGHDFRIDEVGAGTSIFAEGSESLTVELEPGEYTFFCSVPGHRDAGMEGKLIVE